jgi:hypothetical protein
VGYVFFGSCSPPRIGLCPGFDFIAAKFQNLLIAEYSGLSSATSLMHNGEMVQAVWWDKEHLLCMLIG